MSILIMVLLVVWGAIIWWIWWFFGYKKTMTEKAIKFKERMARAKEIEEEILEEAKKKWEERIRKSGRNPKSSFGQRRKNGTKIGKSWRRKEKGSWFTSTGWRSGKTANG